MERDRQGLQARRRVLRFLSGGAASVRPASKDGHVLLEAAGRGAISVESVVLSALAAQGVLVRASHSVALSTEGAALAACLASPSQAFQDRHRELDLVTVESASGSTTVLANLAESPLAQLVRRKTREGKPFLSEREFQAANGFVPTIRAAASCRGSEPTGLRPWRPAGAPVAAASPS